MQQKYIYLLLLFFCVQTIFTATAQSSTAPGIIWQKTVGGNDADILTSLSVGADKTFVVCGSSKSNASGNKSDASVGGYDYWVVKMDSSGAIIWNKTFGGKSDDFAAAIINTSDGGYLVGGTSISDKFGAKSTNSFKKSSDYWVLKLDANGNKIWDVTLGGFYTEKMTSLAELPTGGYVIGGYAYSDNTGVKTSKNLGAQNDADYWMTVLKTDGTLSSQNIFGGTSQDVLTSVSPAGGSEVYLAGYSYSLKASGHKTQSPVGDDDYWIVRCNLSGKIDYQGDFGGSRSDYLTSIQALTDGSLIAAGYSNSPASSSKSGNFLGVTDYWLLKLKADGKKQWDRTIGGTGGDYLVSVRQTKDKGFILGGYSNSNISTSKTENSKGGNDYWIVKTDSLGFIQWDKTIGGSGDDKLNGVYELDSNQYIVAGTSNSGISGDKDAGTIGSIGASDYWILRLGTINPPPHFNNIVLSQTTNIAAAYGALSLQAAPNPVKNILTVQYSAAANGNADFVIYTATGKPVLKAALPVTTTVSVHNFNMANLPAGVYFVVMQTGNKGDKISKVIVKE